MPLETASFQGTSDTDVQRHTSKSNHHLDNAREAAKAARDHLREAKAHVGDGMSNAKESTKAAMHDAKVMASETSQAAMDKGALYVEKAENMIRERPLTSIGVAFAAGWLISRVLRRR